MTWNFEKTIIYNYRPATLKLNPPRRGRVYLFFLVKKKHLEALYWIYIWLDLNIMAAEYTDGEVVRMSLDSYCEVPVETLPVHTVELDSFLISAFEVTVGQYKLFLDAKRKEEKQYRLPDVVDLYSLTDNHPIVGVTWYEATVFCEWAGMRLPTEAEWEYAARGGLTDKRFANGGRLKHADANFKGKGEIDIWGQTSPVASFKPNNYGLFDVMGNVWEWCEDLYDENYYLVSEAENPKGPESTPMERRVIRGGSWMSFKHFLRVALRNYQNPEMKNNYTGFRCVVDLN